MDISITSTYEKNIITSQLETHISVGDSVQWDIEGVEPHNELPKKKKKNPEKWAKNVEKFKKRKGLEYMDNKGNVKKKMLMTEFDEIESCPNCRRKCNNFIDKECQQNIRNEYWQIQSEEDKMQFLQRYIERESKAVTKTNTDKENKRKYTFKYFLPKESQEMQQVCIDIFLKTLGVTERRVKTVRSRKYDANLSYDESIRHGNALKPPNNKFPDAVINSIHEHIKRFPTVPSHYQRKDSKRYYFEKGLSRGKLCDSYNAQPGVKTASLSTYKRVLPEYNIGFHTPKKDACTRCTQYKNSEKTDARKQAYVMHLENKDMAREEKERDTIHAQKENTFTGIIGDLEQVSPCPRALSSEFFYISKISCYNYTLFDLGTKDGYCYCWDEPKAGRGSNEISSCLHHFLSHVGKDISEVVIWADTCSGQNRNQYLTSIMLKLIEDRGNNINQITLKYFESGYSQSEIDTIHYTLEKAEQFIEIYDPS